MVKKRLSVIVPCYNEAESLPLFFAEVEKIREKTPYDFEYLFINDGSQDSSLKVLRQLQLSHPKSVHYLSFSRNFGKEAAIFAGLENSTGDLVTLMDADLQDPPELLLEMIDKMQANEEIDCVAARRSDREGEAWIISAFSRLFYQIMNRISTIPIPSGVRDFRLMKRPMVDAIIELSEYNRFSKGLFSWVGFETDYIDYHNVPRVAGKTSWGIMSKVNYAIDGFVNFSDAPLNLATYGGLLVVFADIIAVIVLIIRQLFFKKSVSGWTSIVVIILFTFGLTLMMLGIIGKYIAKIFLEVKGRPVYIVKEKK